MGCRRGIVARFDGEGFAQPPYRDRCGYAPSAAVRATLKRAHSIALKRNAPAAQRGRLRRSYCSKAQSPICFAMITFMISLVPAKMRWTRASA